MIVTNRPIYYNRQGEPISAEIGSPEFYNAWDSDRTVAKDEIGDVTVSTVFLVIDHAYDGYPLLFETMVFGGDSDQYQRRYHTEAEALAGHAETLAAVKSGVDLYV